MGNYPTPAALQENMHTIVTARGKLKYVEVSNRTIALMSGEQLTQERDRVERELKEHRMNCMGQPAWYKAIPEIRGAKNCLRYALRRINAELERRTQSEVMPFSTYVQRGEWLLDAADATLKLAEEV